MPNHPNCGQVLRDRPYKRRRGAHYVAIVTTAGRIGGLWDSVVKMRPNADIKIKVESR